VAEYPAVGTTEVQMFHLPVKYVNQLLRS